MAGYKVDRISEDVKRELTDIMRSLKDPRISGLITIVRTEMSKDMSQVKVYVSSMDGIEGAKEAVKGLKSAAGFIRREINNRLEMRRSPAFQFVADDSIAHSADIARILGNLADEKK